MKGRIEREVTLNLLALRGLRGGATDTDHVRRYLLGLTLLAATSEMDLFLREGCLLRYGGKEDVDTEGHSCWRTVTIHKGCRSTPKPVESAAMSVRSGGVVVQALRHAVVHLHPEMIRVQREPVEAKGERTDKFAEGPRFSRHRLWHVEVQFPERIPGALVIGDGRFLRLGRMRPLSGRIKLV